MNWTAVNAVAQIIAATGVIGTLVYLAVQIRQNTRSIRRAAFQELLNHIAQINLLLMDRDAAEMVVRARGGLGAIDDVDKMRWVTWFVSVFRHYQNAHAQYCAGVLTTQQWDSLAQPIARLLSDRGGQEAWAVVSSSFSPQFRALVDSRRPEAVLPPPF